MTRVYYKEAVGALVVFDVTRSGTFEAVQKWKADLDNNLSTPERALPCILCANKVHNACRVYRFTRSAQHVSLASCVTRGAFATHFVCHPYHPPQCDLAKEPLDKARMDQYIADHNFIGWFETSAKEDIGIKKAFNELVGFILSHDPEVSERGKEGTVKLGEGGGAGGAAGAGGRRACAC